MKTAIVLFNLGGPDRPEAVKPFRVNLFMDPAIIRAPIFVRFWLSRLIAARTAPAAQENYALLGGRSPLLDFTERQAAALRVLLGADAKVVIAMRYWHPLAAEAVRAVRDFAPERILLLPLYPQYSTTTTGSSLADWHEQAAKAGLVCETTTLCCYFDDPGYVASVAVLVARKIAEARAVLTGGRLRLLFSAHGLPQTIVDGGDPYQWQVERTVAAVLARLADPGDEAVVCYQSRATPQKWIEPSTMAEVERAGRDRVAVLLVPIAFVSDHIETLVELDVENFELAKQVGVPAYFRAAVPNDDPAFITGLAGLARRALAAGPGMCGQAGPRACPADRGDCPMRTGP